MTSGATWAKQLKLKDMLKGAMKEKKKEKSFSFLLFEREREKKGEEVSFQKFSLRSLEIGWLEFIGPRTKVHLLNESYAWVPKSRDFFEDLSKEFVKSKVSGLGSVHGTS